MISSRAAYLATVVRDEIDEYQPNFSETNGEERAMWTVCGTFREGIYRHLSWIGIYLMMCMGVEWTSN